MLKLPKLIYKLKLKIPIIYLWRTMRYLLPVLAVTIVIGIMPKLARIIL